MIVLTKKYRLIWNTESGQILNNYKEDYGDSQTLVNDIPSYFESDNYDDIIEEISKNVLWEGSDIPE